MKVFELNSVSLNNLNTFKKREIVLKHLVKYGIQRVHTPFSLVNYMIPKDLPESICVIFNLEFLEILKFVRKYDMTKVTFFGDSEVEVLFAKRVYKVENSFLVNEETWNKIIKKEINAQEVFMSKMKEAPDITFSNPPYENKDLRIIKALVEANCIKKLICVHPWTWLIETKSRFRFKSNFKDFRNLVKQHLNKAEIFDSISVFKTSAKNNCVISEIDFTKSSNEIWVKFLEDKDFIKFSNLDEITIHKDNWKYIKQLIEKLNAYIKDYGSFEQKRISAIEALSFYKDKAFVQISFIRNCKMNEGAFFTLFNLKLLEPKIAKKGAAHPSTGKTKEELIKNAIPRSISKGTPTEIVYIFNSEKEKENFLKTIETDFMRLCLSILKINGNLGSQELNFIPWLDFSKSWTDNELFSFFGFEKGHPLREYSKTFLPDYHNIYPNGKDY